MINIAKKNVELWSIIDADHIICIESTPDITIRLRDGINIYIPQDDVNDTVISQSEPIEFYPMNKENKWFKCLISVLENAQMKKTNRSRRVK